MIAVVKKLPMPLPPMRASAGVMNSASHNHRRGRRRGWTVRPLTMICSSSATASASLMFWSTSRIVAPSSRNRRMTLASSRTTSGALVALEQVAMNAERGQVFNDRGVGAAPTSVSAGYQHRGTTLGTFGAATGSRIVRPMVKLDVLYLLLVGAALAAFLWLWLSAVPA